MYVNKAIIYGNLTRDPEKRALPNGGSVTSFSVATNRTYNDKDGNKQEETEYHNVVAFGKIADIMAQYLQKGRPVFIEGRLTTRSWEKDGQKQYRTEIVADNFQFGPNTEASPSKVPNTSKEHPGEDINPEDIPFN